MAEVQTEYKAWKKSAGFPWQVTRIRRHEEMPEQRDLIAAFMLEEDAAEFIAFKAGDLEDMAALEAHDLAQEQMVELSQDLNARITELQRALTDERKKRVAADARLAASHTVRDRERDGHNRRVNRINAILKAKEDEVNRLQYLLRNKSKRIQELEREMNNPRPGSPDPRDSEVYGHTHGFKSEELDNLHHEHSGGAQPHGHGLLYGEVLDD